jgi:hypothetical protein
MGSKAKTVAEYLAELTPADRAVVSKVRATIRKNLPRGYRETMAFGMVSYVVASTATDAKPAWYAALAAHKSGYSIYLMGVYASKALRSWFEREYAKSGKRLDLGKSCVRFKALDQLPLPLIGKAIAKLPASKYLATVAAAKHGAR